jgi:hypothetical protein
MVMIGTPNPTPGGLAADFTNHAGWGDHIDWTRSEEFRNKALHGDNLYSVDGHLPVLPKVSQTLLGEFERSYVVFEFVAVDIPGDPPDQFFGKVKPIRQEMKEEKQC